MKTNWEQISLQIGTLRPDGSEFLSTKNAYEALELILGDEWLRDTVDTFIEGRKGWALASLVLRQLHSQKAADYAFQVFQDNTESDENKARLAVWAMNDVRHASCMAHAEAILDSGDERYCYVAIVIVRNLIFDDMTLESDDLMKIVAKCKPFMDEEGFENLKNYLKTKL